MLTHSIEKKKEKKPGKNKVTTYEDVSIKLRAIFSEIFCIYFGTPVLFL